MQSDVKQPAGRVQAEGQVQHRRGGYSEAGTTAPQGLYKGTAPTGL
jgi:hypothetical protein